MFWRNIYWGLLQYESKEQGWRLQDSLSYHVQGVRAGDGRGERGRY